MRASLSLLFSFLALASPAFAQQVATLTLRTNDLIYDGTRGKLYASVPGSWGADGNSIAVIDPALGVVETYIPVGSEPNPLALSDDGRYLYVGLDGAFAVQRVDLATLTPDLQFGLGSSSSYGSYLAKQVAVVPGVAEAAVVLRSASGTTQSSVVVYDAGVQRPTASADGYYRSLAVTDFETLYVSGENSSTLTQMLLHPLGVFTVRTASGVLTSNARIVIDGGRLFATSGHVVDPGTLVRLGLLPVPSTSYPSLPFSAVAPDSPAHAAFTLSGTGTSTIVRAYDTDAFTASWSFRPSGVLGTPGSLVRWGPSGLAFRTDKEQVFLLDISGGGVLTVGKAGFGNGIVTSTPSAINCGADCVALLPDLVAVSLTVVPRSGSRFVGWQGDSDCLDGTVTMTAAMTCTAVFEPLAPDAVVSIPLTANDIVYAPSLGLMLASIPGADAMQGNTITAIDPVTGNVGPSVWVGSEPNRLTLSGDGQYVYVGLDGPGAIRRVALPSFVADLQFWLRASPDRALDLAVAPGQPDTLAIVRADKSVAIYDAGVQRSVTTSTTNYVESLAFSGSLPRLYGYDNYSRFYRLGVYDTGAYLIDVTRYLISGSSPRIRFDSGRLYADNGQVIDPEALTMAGTFPATAPAGLALDAAGGAFMLHRPVTAWTVSRYDRQRFTLLESLAVPNVTGTPRSVISAGAGRVAFLTRESTEVAGDLFITSVRPGAAPVATRGDFDGDGKADPGIFRGPDGTWWLQSSSGGAPRGIVWGLETDLPVPADYDGDGTIDIAVFRPSSGRWYLLLSSSGYTTADSFQWGTSGDLPAPGDWDGDGAAEAAVFRPSTGEWFLRLTPGSAIVHARYRWGADGDVPVHADYDGDGTVDLAVYRPSTGFWHVRYSTANYTLGSSWQWGLATDVPVPGDWDGDGRADAAVYRPAAGQWYLRLPGAWPVQWGAPGDVPVPADYDGDRRLDIAVYRPSTGMWYVRGLFTRAWGAPGDTPVTGR